MMGEGNTVYKSGCHLFSENLKYYRKKKGLSQKQLAGLIHINLDAIGAMERGERAAHIDEVVDIASILNASLDDLVINKHP